MAETISDVIVQVADRARARGRVQHPGYGLSPSVVRRQRDRIRLIEPRDGEAAGLMACGYAKVTAGSASASPPPAGAACC